MSTKLARLGPMIPTSTAANFFECSCTLFGLGSIWRWGVVHPLSSEPDLSLALFSLSLSFPSRLPTLDLEPLIFLWLELCFDLVPVFYNQKHEHRRFNSPGQQQENGIMALERGVSCFLNCLSCWCRVSLHMSDAQKKGVTLLCLFMSLPRRKGVYILSCSIYIYSYILYYYPISLTYSPPDKRTHKLSTR